MYGAPELFVTGKHSMASDVWAFGITIVECLTGQPPWTNTVLVANCKTRQPDGIAKKILPGPVKLIQQPKLKELVINMLDYDPKKRPCSKDLPAKIA